MESTVGFNVAFAVLPAIITLVKMSHGAPSVIQRIKSQMLLKTRTRALGLIVALTAIPFGWCGCQKQTSDALDNRSKDRAEALSEKSSSDKSTITQSEKSLPVSPLKELETNQLKGVPDGPEQSPEQLAASSLTTGQRTEVQKTDALPPIRPPMEIDQELVAASGIQRIQGKHIDIYTDVRDRKEFLEFAEVFDQAVPQWCAYFDIDHETVKDWKMSGFVVLDKDRFRRAGLFPDDLPEFLAGWQNGCEFWVYPQLGEYYTRHLVLHEGTHAFMNHFLGGTGPAWYSEGMAELLALHRWKDRKLTLRYPVGDTNECPYWGRVAVIREDLNSGTSLSLDDIFAIQGREFLKVRAYAWAWAACDFFESHPLTRGHFMQLRENADNHSPMFNLNFKKSIYDSYPQLNEQWEMFVAEVEYGYDVARAAIDYDAPNQSLPATVDLDVSRGWQSSGIQLEKGQQVKLDVSGRFVVANDNGETWPCEADGITISYYRGRPLGQLVGHIHSGNSNGESSFADPTQWITLGSNVTLIAPRSGTVYFRINESPARLDDNSGTLKISIDKNSAAN
jgi:hypothetical protein